MKHLNAALIAGVTIVFLFLNIYGLIEILRYLRDKQPQRQKHPITDGPLEVDVAESVEVSTTKRPITRTTTSTAARTTFRTRTMSTTAPLPAVTTTMPTPAETTLRRRITPTTAILPIVRTTTSNPYQTAAPSSRITQTTGIFPMVRTTTSTPSQTAFGSRSTPTAAIFPIFWTTTSTAPPTRASSRITPATTARPIDTTTTFTVVRTTLGTESTPTTSSPPIRTTTSSTTRTTPRPTSSSTMTPRTLPPTTSHRRPEYGHYDKPHLREHPHRHHHVNHHHRIHPYYIPSTTTSTAPPRIHITTNKIPDPSIDRSRIGIHRPPLKESVRHDVSRNEASIHVPKFPDPAPPFRSPFPHHHYTTSSSTTTSTTPPPEKDDVTIVTALMDIGRGDWDRYRRPLEQYHLFMENLLSLQNYMVIFTDISSYSFIHKYRKNMGEMHRTKIHLITLNDLPLARHLDAASKIIEDEHRNDKLWRSIWDPAMKDHPEARSAEYDVLVNSKTYFLYNATIEDPFSTEFFVWIDAGYGHGNQSVFPYNNKWKPHFPSNKISLIKLTPVHDSISGYNIGSLYRRNWSVISGGFVAGDKRSIGQLYTLVHRKFIELTYHNKVDDDQTVLVLVINSYPQLFSITHGDWFDAFRLFSSDQSQYG